MRSLETMKCFRTFDRSNMTCVISCRYRIECKSQTLANKEKNPPRSRYDIINISKEDKE